MENKWCDYSALLAPPIICNRFEDEKDNRFYWYFDNDGQLQISIGVTSAFGMVSTEREAINAWKEKHKDNWRQLLSASAAYGTNLHACYCNLTHNQPIDKSVIEEMQSIAVRNNQSYDMPTKDILSFKQFMSDVELVPLLNEAKLVWIDPQTGEGLCMTIDLLAKIKYKLKRKELVQEGFYERGEKKGQAKLVEKMVEYTEEKIALIDYKSNFFEKDSKSFFETHQMQLIAAKKAVEQNFPDITVDYLFNWAPNNWRGELATYTFYKWEVNDEDYQLFYDYWRLIINPKKHINKPVGKILKADMETGSFRHYTYMEYIQEVILGVNEQ